jgi:hypothetical protein
MEFFGQREVKQEDFTNYNQFDHHVLFLFSSLETVINVSYD